MKGMPPLALLAGGKGTRLGALTATRPKSLVPVAGKPFIEHQLSLFKRNGVRQVVICAGHLADQIQRHVEDGQRFGLDVRYSLDSQKLLGTGGALRQALDLLGDRFWVMYGDAYLDIDFKPVLEAFEKSGAPALMTVFRNDNQWGASNVRFELGKIHCYNKTQRTAEMKHIDYGLSLFRSDTLRYWQSESAEFDLADILTALASTGELAGYEVSQRFYEVGSAEGLKETEAYLKGRA